MKETYNLNELALMTGLTTRTLRNYLRQGALNGEKIDGAWTFTVEEIEAFMADPAVRRAFESRQNAVVYDFLADDFKRANRICTIIDYAADDAEAEAISQFYCDCARRASDVELRIGRRRDIARVILSGSEDTVMDILRQYYCAPANG